MNAIAKEGYPYIIIFAATTIVVLLLGGKWMVIAPFIITVFMFYFFRDPEREIPEGEGLFVSPADGKVILIKNIIEPTPFLVKSPSFPPLKKGDEGGFIVFAPIHQHQSPLKKGDEGGFIEISIFMSPLNVHVNRAPCDGTVESVVHTSGKFLSAFKHEASLQNENIAMVMNTKYGKILVRQVAGFLARRAVCRVKAGDSLKRGERYGIIKFSSRLDVYLPKDSEIKVKLGDKVKAGETVIGLIK